MRAGRSSHWPARFHAQRGQDVLCIRTILTGSGGGQTGRDRGQGASAGCRSGRPAVFGASALLLRPAVAVPANYSQLTCQQSPIWGSQAGGASYFAFATQLRDWRCRFVPRRHEAPSAQPLFAPAPDSSACGTVAARGLLKRILRKEETRMDALAHVRRVFLPEGKGRADV
jgi:hypothetical protein